MSPDSANIIATARQSVPAGVDVAAYVNLLAPIEPGDFDGHAQRLLNVGADELELYHFGIANKSQLPLFAALASASG
jgi:hypothetical protein